MTQDKLPKRSILDPDGNPVPSKITVRERWNAVFTNARMKLIAAATVVAGIAGLLSNLATIQEFVSLPPVSEPPGEVPPGLPIPTDAPTRKVHVMLYYEGEFLLEDFEIYVRDTELGQVRMRGEEGAATISIPSRRDSVEIEVIMEQHAMRDHPPLEVFESSVKVEMVDKAIPKPVVETSSLPTLVSFPNPVPAMGEERLLRLRIRNSYSRTVYLFLYGLASREWESIRLQAGESKILEIRSKEDSQYYFVIRRQDGTEERLGWIDLGKIEPDSELAIADTGGLSR